MDKKREQKIKSLAERNVLPKPDSVSSEIQCGYTRYRIKDKTRKVKTLDVFAHK